MADLYRAKDRGKSLAIASLLPYLGPALGPIVGGVVTQLIRWEWIFWIMSMFNAAVTFVGIACVKETYTPVILRRRADAVRKQTCRDIGPRLLENLQRPMRLLFTRPAILVVAWVLAVDFGTYCFMLSTFASLWIDKYHQSELHSSLHYVSIAIGTTISGQLGGRLIDLM